MKIFTKTCLSRSVLPVLLIMLCAWAVSAQRTITGTVKDGETGEGLIGVNIVEKENRSNGGSTDLEGNFSLKVSKDATTLIMSYSGFETAEVSIVGTDKVTVTMKTSAILDEVVIIGYGEVKRKDATGLVQSVSSGQFNRGAITGPQELLAGKVAGVVISTDGAPGGGSKIRIRGESSLSASNDPLIVIDGVPLDNGGVSGARNFLNIVNPNDIESLTILKDASATAIYGNRASAGVILITTKKGQLGKKIRVNYNANVSSAETMNRVDMLSAAEFRDAINRRYYNPDPAATQHPAFAIMGTASTDWQDVIYQNAVGQDHNLALSGGVGKVPYRVSVGFTNKDGLLKTDNFKRYTLGVNLNPKFINNTLQFNLHFKGMLNDNHFADNGAIGNALRMDPTQPVYDTSARYGGYSVWKIGNGNPNGLAPYNPLSRLELRNDNATVRHYIVNGSVDYRFAFLPDLRANFSVGLDKANGEGTVKVPNYAAFSFDAINGGGTNNYYEQSKTNSVLETYLNYKKKFGEHDLDLMTGYSWQHFEVDNFYKNMDAAGTPAETTMGTDPAEYFLVSLYSRLNYNFKDKYYFTASVRNDGTSRLAPEHRWGVFPAAAFSVRLIDNDHKYFNNVKLRTSWGVTGQQDIGDYYAYLARYEFGDPNATYQLGNEFVSTVRPNGYIYDTRWEETTTYNAGLDFIVIDKLINGTLDVYQRNTEGLLSYIPLPALSNLSNFGTVNIGTMVNKGVEFGLNLMPIQSEKVTWDVSFNVAYNKGKITKLTTSDDSTFIGNRVGGIAGGVGSNIQIHSVGYQPYSFFVYEQKYDDNGGLLENQFVDQNEDGLINEQDLYRFKNPSPRWTYGFSSSLRDGNFTLSFAGRANIGQYVYNNVQSDMGFLNRLYHSSRYLSNIHSSGVDLNVLEQSSLTFSDHFVKKANFFRLDHITGSYDFSKLTKRDFRVYATVQNPFVITQYDGLDPEIGNGIDNNIYPRPRTYLFGLSINL